MQCTIESSVAFDGVGLHSGAPARAVICPAEPDTGIVFRRTDRDPAEADVPALWNLVRQSPLQTSLTNRHGVSVSTVEHVMAALAGCGVHNAVVEVDGEELPILDGSAAPFVRGILAQPERRSDRPIRAVRVLAPVEVIRGDSSARLEPCDTLEIDFEIDFADEAIGRQSRTLNMANGAFVHELAECRTFCTRADAAAMLALGLGRGGIPGENAVVFDGGRIISPGGVRRPDEPVRHKMLDALGDLWLAGMPLLGRYRGRRAGHALTNELLRSLFATPGASEVVECGPEQAARLPGAGLER